MKKIKMIETKTGYATIEKHECRGTKNYPYLGNGVKLAIEKAAVYAHDAFYHWYIFIGSSTVLKDIRRCPFCGKRLSKMTPIPNFDEPDEY